MKQSKKIGIGFTASRIVMVSMAIACGLTGLFWDGRSSANSQDKAAAAELAVAVETQQQAAEKLKRNEALDEQVQQLNVKVQQAGTVPVIVRLRATFRPEGELTRGSDLRAQRLAINRVQDELVNDLYGYDPASLKRIDHLPYLAVKVNTAGLESLRASSKVLDIQEDAAFPPSLAESVPSVGGTAAWASGYTGAGKVVAILDTGVDKTHPFLTGKVVSEACYSSNDSGSGVSSVCPGGASESTAVGSGVNCTGLGDCNHGTHVAGIAAGKGTNFSGVAKDANLIAIQVFSRYTGPECGGSGSCLLARTSDIMKALSRVYELRNSYSIASVNLSLGGGKFTGNCDTNVLKTSIDQLRSAGIATVIAAGNNGFTDSLSMPACISSAVSVGATGDGGQSSAQQVQSYSNSASFLNLLAPGGNITSSIPGGSFAVYSGTSMATPHVAGAWAILKQKAPAASVTEVLSALTKSGTPITDTRNGLTFPRIQIKAAADAMTGTPTTIPVPVVKSIDPGTPVAGNTDQNLKVVGENFGTGLTVAVFYPGNNTDTPSATLSGAQIPSVTAPGSFVMRLRLGATGSWGIRVKNPNDGGTSARFNFTVKAPAPAVKSIDPGTPIAVNIDQNLKVVGENFVAGLTVAVFNPGNNTDTPNATLSGAQITSISAPGSFVMRIRFETAGTWGIRVKNPNDGGTSARFNFTVK
ncbi:MAG TPA: S8 family serine peptidase, partial [Blastocatellia bacterium]|nr:S8 family serine peptidase [Blastocatellia bacterium]